MSIAKRKIGFYSLVPTDLSVAGPASSNPQIIIDIIDFIMSLNKFDRIYDLEQNKRFHLLNYAARNGNVEKLIFTSGKYNHRPPLIDKETADERDNPKTLSEGESEKTHVVLKYNDDEIILLKEERFHGIHINTIVNYFYKMLWTMNKNLNYKINFSIIPKTDFYHELAQLNRVTIGEAHVERQLIGSEYLNYSDRIENVKNSIQITIKARRGRSIKDTLVDLYNKATSASSNIKKIRVYGTNVNGDNVLLDSDIIKMVEYLKTNIDEITGIVNSEMILTNLAKMISGF